MALHGGIVPYGGTFLVFSDYCRPSIRLSALMGQRVIYVMTHDSIGLGEDGPTHQPVEHLAALRAMPNLNVMRPADSVECAECWEIALSRQDDALDPRADPPGRAAAPHRRHQREPVGQGRLCADRGRQGKRDVTLIGTGSELALAVEAAKALAEEGIKAAVVSMPCWELFEAQARGLSERGPGHRPARRRRGGGRVRLGEMARGRGRLHRHAWIRGFCARRKTYISISASRPRPWRPPLVM